MMRIDALAAACRLTSRVTWQELHRAGIEVILDVVYNHTAEARACNDSACVHARDCFVR